MTPRDTTRGFTLVEVLAATALFAVLGTLLFQLVDGALDVQSRGERVAELEQRAGAVLDLLAEDLRHGWQAGPAAGRDGGGLEGGLLWDLREEDLTGRGPGEVQAVGVLRFTRLLHEARGMAWLRDAGRPGRRGVASLTGDDAAELQPTGGLAETLYTVAPVGDGPLPVLVRRVRTPAGGTGSLLLPEVLQDAAALVADGLPLAPGVLHLGVSAWDDVAGAWAPPTRGGFPTHLRLELALAADPEASAGLDGAPGRLREELGEDDATLVLRSATLSGDAPEPEWLWIEGEWLRVTRRDGPRWTVERGQRGTLPATHPAGAAVHVARHFERVVAVPVGREEGRR